MKDKLVYSETRSKYNIEVYQSPIRHYTDQIKQDIQALNLPAHNAEQGYWLTAQITVEKSKEPIELSTLVHIMEDYSVQKQRDYQSQSLDDLMERARATAEEQS